MARRIYADDEECISCGICEEICEDVFRLNEDTSRVEVIEYEEGPEDLIEEAMESCPVECIYWDE
ncbi:MAG: ferredoxin [Deltaproteobacteria bacterium]|nr:ferredoxin [Deltaproteobacteria bacterium]